MALALTVLPGGPASAEPADEPDYTFVSMPDFLNADVADLSLSPAASWRDGDPNSSAPGYEDQIGVVLDEVARAGATDVLVAGDLVEGRWGSDTEATGIFGPVDTFRAQKAAVRLAAATYYPVWRERFDVRGLTTYTALGDHEIGDNPWNATRGKPYPAFRHRANRLFKHQWAHYLNGDGERFRRHPSAGPARRTAYATFLHPEVLLVTVDVFERTEDDVVIDVDPAQLDWLRHTLARAQNRGVDWVLVQGHVPVLRPVRTSRSSVPPLRFEGGRESDFWRTLAEYDVDLYLNGEVHATTAKRARGVTQVSHGGLFYPGDFSYLVGRVSGDRLDLETRAFEAATATGPLLWQTHRRTVPSLVRYPTESYQSGAMGLTRDGTVLYRTGLLAPYRPGE